MAGALQRVTSSAPGRAVMRRLGVPVPAELVRHQPGDPAVRGPVLIGGTPAGRLRDVVSGVVKAAGAEVLEGEPSGEQRPAALVFDATGLASTDDLAALYEFAHPRLAAVARCSRVVVLTDVPEFTGNVSASSAARAVEGFTRSLGKEMRGGGTSQLVRVAPGAEGTLESPLRFLLSGRSAYVSGQVIKVEPAGVPEVDWSAPLRGKVAAVTGAARGIGAVVAELLARDGAHVVVIDLPQQAEQLRATAKKIGGTALGVDITASEAPTTIVRHLQERHGGVDVFVHNAGITRDRTLVGMKRAEWDSVLDVNLGAVHRITAALLGSETVAPALHDGGALVCTSSIGGIAGNRGQTNYGASKAGLIGLVEALAPIVRDRGVRVNAVAPGFIETDMTAKMPLFVREAGRRMNSLAQAGLPVDVAEAIAWLSAPATAGVTGQVLRVCGQSLLGA